MSNTPEITAGSRLGDYEIGAELGRGGVAVVHEVKHAAMESQGPLAIKIAHRTSAQRDFRFVREFERTRVIALPGVPRVYDVGMSDDLIWFVMDLVPGQPIHRAMRNITDLRGRIGLAIEAGARMCDALAGIHRLGFIHRDVKPSNVLVSDDGETHLLDFGLVRLQERGDTLTRAGRLVGTVAFMSPEQTTGLPLTSGTDIFSAGLLLYEGLLGPRPRPARQEEWLGRMCLQQITPMSVREPEIPRALSTIVERMLSLDPHARPSASEAAQMLRDLGSGKFKPAWPHPPKFVGRDVELDRCFTAFKPDERRMVVVEGDVGTGRRRLLEQIQRRALLYGTPRVTGVCRPHISGGAVMQILTQLFSTHADPEWRVKTAGPDVAALLSMWPSLPLPAPPPSDRSPTLNEVAEAAAKTLHRGVDSTGLMVVFERLDQVDSLTARVIQMLLENAPDRLAIMTVMEPRWASARALKLVDHLELTDRAVRIKLPPLSSPQATEIASSLNDDAEIDPIDGGTPQMARNMGLIRLAQKRGETRPDLPPALAVLGLATFPLPRTVLRLLEIDPDFWTEQGVLCEEQDGFVLADNWLRQHAQSLISNRMQAEDALADALVRSNVGPDKSANIARHMLHGCRPDRALPYAIRAAVTATEQSRFSDARDWLMAIDPMKRDKNEPTYRALRFDLAWARAQTSLRTDLSRVREDLVVQARERAISVSDRYRCELLEADLAFRQGKYAQAIEDLLKAKDYDTPEITAWRSLKAGRVLLDQGKPAEARQYLRGTDILGTHPNRALVGIDMALLEGKADTALEGCRQAIARGKLNVTEPYLGVILLRRGWSLLAIGDRVGVTQAAHRAQDLLATHGHRARHTEARHLVALLALGRGQPRAARVVLDPMITAARAFGLSHLGTLGAALKLRVAAAMNDKVAARATLSASTREEQESSPDWRLAGARWHRVQRDMEAAMALAEWKKPTTPAAVFLTIEAARLQLAAGNDAAGNTFIQSAIASSKSRGFAELLVLASLIAGALNHEEEERWPVVLHQAKSSPWVELSLTALAMAGRRALRRKEKETARQHFETLLQRAEHLDHHYHRVVANEALVQL